MMETIGFLGCGNMGGAIARAVCKAADPKKVYLANRTTAKAQALAKELGCKVATNAEVAAECDLIFLAVKPQMMEGLLTEIAPGVDLQKDVLDQMGFLPILSKDLKQMDPRIFQAEKMGLTI